MFNKSKPIDRGVFDENLKNLRFWGRPAGGWIAVLRKSLSMNVRQLAKRMGITQQAASRLEAREIDHSITLRSLRKAAEAMDCQLVYAFIPRKDGLQDIVNRQAMKKAQELLDAQVTPEKIKQVAHDLAANLNSKLWE